MPLDSTKEKNFDILCMRQYQETLFLGTRNHVIRRVGLSNFESLP